MGYRTADLRLCFCRCKNQVFSKLICAFVFAYANIRFSHEAAHTIVLQKDADIRANREDPDQTAPQGGMTTERLQQIFWMSKKGILQYLILGV